MTASLEAGLRRIDDLKRCGIERVPTLTVHGASVDRSVPLAATVFIRPVRYRACGRRMISHSPKCMSGDAHQEAAG